MNDRYVSLPNTFDCVGIIVGMIVGLWVGAPFGFFAIITTIVGAVIGFRVGDYVGALYYSHNLKKYMSSKRGERK